MDTSNIDFRTQKGYDQLNSNPITPSMEDYLEMIYRHHISGEFIRISTLAKKLNVKNSSVSKMIINLRTQGLIEYEKYGNIVITEEGLKLGKYLLHRHEVLNKFFCLINGTSNETEQIEQIEHFINKPTIENIELLIPTLESFKNNKYSIKI